MKLRCALVLFLAACVCSFGQSASTILSSLRIKGATSDGGAPKYENYIPRLDGSGRLDYSFMPTNMLFSDIMDSLDERGVEFNTELTFSVSNTLAAAISNQFESFNWLAHEAASNAVITALDAARNDPIIMEYSYDKSAVSVPIFTNMTTVAIGSGAAANDGAWQLGTGTNSIPDTLMFRSTVLVGGNGELPASTAPWACTTNVLNGVSNELWTAVSSVSNRVYALETTIPTNLLIRSATKLWSLTMTDSGDLHIEEINQ